MRLRGLLGVVSGIALGACVVTTHDGERDSPIGPVAGASGAGGTAGSAGTGGGGTAGSADGAAGRDSAADSSADAATDSETDAGTDGATLDGDSDSDSGTTDGATTDGGASDDTTLNVQCSIILSACPAIALAQCQLYLAGMTASARARMVACMSSGCNLANCARDL
jgi:hypothetical protein